MLLPRLVTNAARSRYDRRKQQTRLENINERCATRAAILLSQMVETEELPEDFDLDAVAYTRQTNCVNGWRISARSICLPSKSLPRPKRRHIFLTSQRQDIIDWIATAEEALREIKERSRARFKDAFEAINANFTEFFQELFGGGRGEMTLLEADDILEAGIEVVAQPPGKRLQNILLLLRRRKGNGGDRTWSVNIQIRPSPFCLLDEVDAPLDEANVGRFVNKIAEMSEKTQFIVITHNKRTMEAARALYGVTMQEPAFQRSFGEIRLAPKLANLLTLRSSYWFDVTPSVRSINENVSDNSFVPRGVCFRR